MCQICELNKPFARKTKSRIDITSCFHLHSLIRPSSLRRCPSPRQLRGVARVRQRRIAVNGRGANLSSVQVDGSMLNARAEKVNKFMDMDGLSSLVHLKV